MPALASDLRRQLENVIIDAREKAEAAARAALKRLAVDAPKPFDHFSDEQRAFRNRLRARARQAGDMRKANGEQEIDQLIQELAYEYWHRMLFARFLAENHLLMHTDGVAVSLAECEELASHEGAENGFVLAARYASLMLPQIFRIDDVLLEVDFPINDRLPLEKLLASLPTDTFVADDSLGWVYQFWQTKKKKEVNESGEKIDGRTLPAVTQLFTEPYMVKFLLHNTIGAWWAGRQGVEGQGSGISEEGLRKQVALPDYEFEYLRFLPDGRPAAGTFDGWPDSLKEFTMLDPCCGSGHFLVEAFNLLVPMRIHNEGLSAQDTCDAVLVENLFGLELDPRCTQIAAFALALAAWKFRGESGEPLGYRPLPPLNIACSGQSVTGKKEEWLALANGDSRLREGMSKLYDLFGQAPHLGSLIDPRGEIGDMFTAGFSELHPLLDKALAREAIKIDADASAVGVAAQGITKAAELLAAQYTLIATNVPFLARGKQSSVLTSFGEDRHELSKADLATMLIERSIHFCRKDGTVAVVSPQNWLFLASYKQMRERLLKSGKWQLIVKLGPNAFQDMNWWAAITQLCILSESSWPNIHEIVGIDVSERKDQEEKAALLRNKKLATVKQSVQLQNVDFVITFVDISDKHLLREYARSVEGLSTGDGDRYLHNFWEVNAQDRRWEQFHVTPDETCHYDGLQKLVFWEEGRGSLSQSDKARIQGNHAWGKRGILISKMNKLKCCLHFGVKHDKMAAVIVPQNPKHYAAIWTFCSSSEFHDSVRIVTQKVDAATASLVRVPFDLEHWQKIADEKYPNGLPDPHTQDPTQWIFKGEISSNLDPLQVAVARMLGYRWPEQSKEKDKIDALADEDGIVCIPAVRTEKPGAERLLDVLRAAYSSEWSDTVLHKLLSDAGCTPGTSLDDWLRNEFFAQHCKRFHNRPFIWHIWDGRKDGFSCLVNYHKLNHKRLETLTYSYLQDWIIAQAAAARDGKTGADLRLVAAQELQNKLKLILTGEPPYDIFVRWKPIEAQPIGWNPDLNDGGRMNIRPFLTAEVLRKKPTVNWSKDRGNEPMRSQEQYPWFWKNGNFTGDRINDYHLTNAQKRAARENIVVEPTRIEREQAES